MTWGVVNFCERKSSTTSMLSNLHIGKMGFCKAFHRNDLHNTPGGFRMIQTYLPNLDDDDVHRCLFALYHRWTQRRHRTRPVFFFWLQGILDRERHRRTVEPPIEVETLEIPSGWSNRELLDGLDDATYLTYVDNVSDACGDMCDQIFITMQFLVCERLQ